MDAETRDYKEELIGEQLDSIDQWILKPGITRKSSMVNSSMDAETRDYKEELMNKAFVSTHTNIQQHPQKFNFLDICTMSSALDIELGKNHTL